MFHRPDSRPACTCGRGRQAFSRCVGEWVGGPGIRLAGSTRPAGVSWGCAVARWNPSRISTPRVC